MTSAPTMSEGIKSGVNWMRLNESATVRTEPWTAFACAPDELSEWLAQARLDGALDVHDFRAAPPLALPVPVAALGQRDADREKLTAWLTQQGFRSTIARLGLDGPAPAPQLRRGGRNLVLLATSTDGASWEKPALGLHAYDGTTANNIVFDAQSPAVVEDRFDRDATRRFKMLAYFSGGYVAAFSADGRRWTEFAKTPVFRGGDTMSLTQDPRTGHA